MNRKNWIALKAIRKKRQDADRDIRDVLQGANSRRVTKKLLRAYDAALRRMIEAAQAEADALGRSLAGERIGDEGRLPQGRDILDIPLKKKGK